MRLHCIWIGCLALVSFYPGAAFAEDPAPNPPVPADAPAWDLDDLKNRALARFEKGVTLFDAGSLEVALTEFLESRRIFPLRAATANALVCLDQLGRHDEALEMAETLLREFGATMPAESRERAQRKLLELRARVGTIEITKAEMGATILIDGKDRGTYPPLGPLRVKAGSHLLRVIMPGFEPFEVQVDVAGAGVAAVKVVQKAMLRSGRLNVVEQAGKALDVVVDGVSVGKTPWQGSLPPGDHVVLLRGEGAWGTLPTPVVITADQTTPLSLRAEELAVRLRIEPSPANAIVALDGITLGRGVWEGALRAGEHRIEVTAQDFLPAAQSVRVAKDEQKTIRVVLQRNPRSLFAVQKAHFTIDGHLNAVLAPSFGGDIGRGAAVGGLVVFNAGYELPSRFSFGISGGGLLANQSTEQRLVPAVPVELATTPTVQNVLVNDQIGVRGLLVGGWGAFTFGNPLLVQFRLGLGAMLGAASDTRSGGSTLAGAWSMQGEATETHPVRAAYLASELRVGWTIRPRVTLSAGLLLLGVFSPEPPTWDEPRTHLVVFRNPAAGPTYGVFGAPKVAPEQILSALEIAIIPGLGLRYDL